MNEWAKRVNNKIKMNAHIKLVHSSKLVDHFKCNFAHNKFIGVGGIGNAQKIRIKLIFIETKEIKMEKGENRI
jgi:hypothetical protein